MVTSLSWRKRTRPSRPYAPDTGAQWPEELPKNDDVPKSPLLQLAALVPIGRHDFKFEIDFASRLPPAPAFRTSARDGVSCKNQEEKS
jgi:hypothetical protein